MKSKEFLKLLELLTGKPVHPSPLPPSDLKFLDAALTNDDTTIDYSQFNELLLMANKDRVESPFFERFFCSQKPGLCQVRSIAEGVRKFQALAMLRFGNFIYAFRMLSKLHSREELAEALGEQKSISDREDSFQHRRARIVNIQDIPREDTFLVGYLSANQVREDYRLATGLLKLLEEEQYSTWTDLQNDLDAMGEGIEKAGDRTVLIKQGTRLLNKFRQDSANTVVTFKERIKRDINEINELYQRLQLTLAKATENTDVYLTWDHMDVYFATSMRKAWEFEDLYDFVHELMERQTIKAKDKTLNELNVRYFDPTQSFDQNRVNKGLIESLMLKRAACTVYSVQDTDTLGKDSELAATLAQGKPVIAFAPEIEIDVRVEQLKQRRPGDLKHRLQWILYEGIAIEDPYFVNSFVTRLDRFEDETLWQSVTDKARLTQFQIDNAEELNRFCTIVASAEKQIYDKRCFTLKNTHPLAIQVNLETGVANGVLVVRDVETCAELIWRVLTNSLEFNPPSYDDDTKCWYLSESLTGSVYRVVTANEKLTNCFWNFYQQRSIN